MDQPPTASFPGHPLDTRAKNALAQLLTTRALENVANLAQAAVVHGQPDSPRRKRGSKLPSASLCNVIFYENAPLEIRYGYPGVATVLEGRLDVVIDKTAYRVRQGDWIVFQRGSAHNEYRLPTGEPYQLLWFQFTSWESRLIESKYSRQSGFQIENYLFLSEPDKEPRPGPADLLDRPDQQVESFQRKLIHLISEWIAILDSATGQRVLHSNPLLDRIRAILAASDSHTLSVTDIARQLGLSLNYVSNSYRRHTGRTLQSVIQARRIEKAIRFLSESDLPIALIAERVGFTTPQHFNHAFHRALGMSPSAWRREHAAK